MSDVQEPHAKGDPNYILSQEEFHAGVATLGQRQLGTEQILLNRVSRETAGLRESIGWVLVLVALQMAILGFGMIKGTIKGSP